MAKTNWKTQHWDEQLRNQILCVDGEPYAITRFRNETFEVNFLLPYRLIREFPCFSFRFSRTYRLKLSVNMDTRSWVSMARVKDLLDAWVNTLFRGKAENTEHVKEYVNALRDTFYSGDASRFGGFIERTYLQPKGIEYIGDNIDVVNKEIIRFEAGLRVVSHETDYQCRNAYEYVAPNGLLDWVKHNMAHNGDSYVVSEPIYFPIKVDDYTKYWNPFYAKMLLMGVMLTTYRRSDSTALHQEVLPITDRYEESFSDITHCHATVTHRSIFLNRAMFLTIAERLLSDEHTVYGVIGEPIYSGEPTLTMDAAYHLLRIHHIQNGIKCATNPYIPLMARLLAGVEPLEDVLSDKENRILHDKTLLFLANTMGYCNLLIDENIDTDKLPEFNRNRMDIPYGYLFTNRIKTIEDI